MNASADKMQALLAGLRAGFVGELPERCDALEGLILRLGRPDGGSAFDEAFRAVHSLKGTGGSFGIGIVSVVCHHFENLLTRAAESGCFDDAFVDAALAYVDLLRAIQARALEDPPDFTAVEEALARLLDTAPRAQHGLIAEASTVMVQIYRQVMADLHVRTSVTKNGLDAIARLIREPYAFAIIGGELEELNGAAIVAALRASQSPRREMPVILVSSRAEAFPQEGTVVVARDENLPKHLRSAIESLLRTPGAA